MSETYAKFGFHNQSGSHFSDRANVRHFGPFFTKNTNFDPKTDSQCLGLCEAIYKETVMTEFVTFV